MHPLDYYDDMRDFGYLIDEAFVMMKRRFPSYHGIPDEVEMADRLCTVLAEIHVSAQLGKCYSPKDERRLVVCTLLVGKYLWVGEHHGYKLTAEGVEVAALAYERKRDELNPVSDIEYGVEGQTNA